jgi:hypothetical protein
MSNRYALVEIIRDEISDESKRAARRNLVRDTIWDLVDNGTYPGGYDQGLAAYAEGHLDIAADGTITTRPLTEAPTRVSTTRTMPPAQTDAR